MLPKLLNNNPDIVRTDYPRPQWMRSEWISLDGKWEMAFDMGESGFERGMVKDGEYPMTVLVPFCPESKLSGIGYTDFIPALWYRRSFSFEKPDGKRVLLHFGAVDYESRVFVNGKECGTHRGGYTPFTYDITDVLVGGENKLVVGVLDDTRSGRQPRGKQSFRYASRGCDYTRTTGIWQTVWLETVPEKYLSHARTVPSAIDGTITATVFGVGTEYGDKLVMTAYYNGKAVGSAEGSFTGNSANLTLTVSEKHLWNVCAPELYDLRLELYGKNGVTDEVWSYFGLRDVSLTDKALTVNGKPVFMRLILDQGHNPDGVCTAPSEEFIKRDIELAMELGFNGARLHQKIFEERTLYHADKLGYMVWDEMPQVDDLRDLLALNAILPEWMALMERDFNHPSVIGWCILNETYHKMALDENIYKTVYRITKAYDSTRPVIDASGGVHYDTDMFDVHDYEQDPEKYKSYFEPMKDDPSFAHDPISRYRRNAPARPNEYKGQPYWVSEYGGTFWNPNVVGKGWGYGNAPKTEEEFAERYEGLTNVLLSHPRICGFCYTQLTDIEQEQNGMYYFDRSRKFKDGIYARIKAANTAPAAIEKE